LFCFSNHDRVRVIHCLSENLPLLKGLYDGLNEQLNTRRPAGRTLLS